MKEVKELNSKIEKKNKYNVNNNDNFKIQIVCLKEQNHSFITF